MILFGFTPKGRRNEDPSYSEASNSWSLRGYLLDSAGFLVLFFGLISCTCSHIKKPRDRTTITKISDSVIFTTPATDWASEAQR